jgi:quercetin dioxygenase-like cupin family protein
MLDERWVFYKDVKEEDQGNGVVRRVLAYSKDLMCVENTFEKGAVGALHHHPHTQITYIVSGKFEFEIDGVKKVVEAGDTMLKMNDVVHGCVCLEAGKLLDIFNPMREDFV